MGTSSDTFVIKITQLIHNSLELEEIYQIVVDEIGQYLFADRCFISRFDSSTGKLCAPTREYCASTLIKSIIREAPITLWGSLNEYARGVCQESEPIDYHDLSEEAKTSLGKLQAHSGLSVAIRFQRCLGILFVQSIDEHRVWSNEDKQILKLIAQQVAAVTHHVDLYQHLEELSVRRQIFNQLYQQAILGKDSQVLFELALGYIEERLAISTGKIIQYLPQQNQAQPLKMVACRGLSSQLIGKYGDAKQEPHAAYTLEAQEPIIVTNIYQERRFNPSGLHQQYGLISGVAVVIRGTRQPFGVLEINDRQERYFSAEDVQFLQAIANLLGTVLERKNVEKLAYKAEQKFKLMVQGLKDYAVAWLNTEGKIESWNLAAENIFGYSAEEILGHSCQLLYTDKDLFDQVPQHLLKTAAEQGQVIQQGPKRCRTGKIIYCEVTITALYEEDHQLLGYVALACDISTRKQEEIALRESEERFRSLVEGSQDYAIYLEDCCGYITLWNPGAKNIYGYTSTEILGTHFSKFLPEEEIQAGLVERELTSASQTGRFETEGWRIRKDGSRFWAVVVLNALYDKDGQINGFINVTRDITEQQLANKALQESRAQFNRVVSGSDEGFWEWDVMQDQLYWSDRLYELLGITRRTVTANYATYESFLHPADKKPIRLSMAKTIEQGVPFQAEFRMRHFSGEYRYFYSRAKPYYDEHGQLMLVSGMLADITERKKTEMALLSTQQRLTVSLSAAQTGTFHWNFKYNFINFDVNMQALLGLSQQEAPVPLSDFTRLVHCDDLSSVIQAFHKSQFEGDEFNMEFRVIWPDHSVHWIYGRGKTFLDSDGKFGYLNGACLETTEKKQAEAQLVASYQALANITNALNVSTIVAITDSRGRITEVNEAFCRISKYSREELLGQDHRILNSGYHSCEFFQNLWATIGQGKIWKGEIRNRAKDGSLYWVDTTIVPFLDEQEKPKQYVAIRHDITLQKSAEIRLLESNRDLEQFAVIASHDLQAPLRKVKMFSYTLTEQAQSKLNQDELELARRMNLSLDAMQQLIQDLLALSRISFEQQIFEEVNLNQVLDHVTQNLEEKIQQTQAELNIGPLEAVYGDTKQITQLLQNLIENALKYHTPGNHPKITVQSDCRAGKSCTIQIHDNGIGIHSEHLERIFKPFERLHGKSSIYSGTGIGLAICKRIVERHQGQIKVESTPGEGTSFIVELPKIRSELSDGMLSYAE